MSQTPAPIIDTPNANPAFTVAHPEFASYQQLYRMGARSGERCAASGGMGRDETLRIKLYYT